jgi:hypothetical protein
VLSLNKTTLTDLEKYLQDPKQTDKNRIVHTEKMPKGALNEQPMLAITFKHPTKNIEARVFAEQTSHEGLRFCFPKELNQSDFTFSAKGLCHLAARIAKPSDEIQLSFTSEAQKDILQKSFQSALEKGIKDKRFDITTAPQLKDDHANKRLSL